MDYPPRAPGTRRMEGLALPVACLDTPDRAGGVPGDRNGRLKPGDVERDGTGRAGAVAVV